MTRREIRIDELVIHGGATRRDRRTLAAALARELARADGSGSLRGATGEAAARGVAEALDRGGTR